MTKNQAMQAEKEFIALAEKHGSVWINATRELRPDLKIIRLEISLKVTEGEEKRL